MAPPHVSKSEQPGAVKVRNISGIPTLLRDLGRDPGEILAAAGVAAEAFRDPENFISYATLGRLADECVRATGRDDFGLQFGIRHSAGVAGLGGFVAINAPTVGEAIETLAASLRLSDTGGMVAVEVLHDFAMLRWDVTVPGVQAVDQIIDAGVAILCNMMRELCGSSWRATEVLLQRRRPCDTKSFSAFFGAPIRFRADWSGLVFPSSELQTAASNRNPALHDVLVPLLRKELRDTAGRFSEHVLLVLRSQILTGPLTQGRTASALGVTERAFARRLESEGETFLKLALRVKYETAQKLLRLDKDLAEIAVTVGYSDVTAFTRAFKAWSGRTPGRWRNEHELQDLTTGQKLG